MPSRQLIGASAGEVIVADSTSVNLFKLAASLLRHGKGRRTVVTERGSFPTDVYVLEGLVDLFDERFDLVLAEPESIVGSIDDRTALVLLTHVNFRTGTMHDMAAIAAHARDRGVPVIWDLSHSAGAVPLALNRWGVEYAVGCTYKFLNGGPGAPAFVYMAKGAIAAHEPVVTGWFSHANQFGFEDRYRPAGGIEKSLVGTPPILSLRAVLHGVACFDDVDMEDVVQKSRRLSELLIRLADDRLAHAGFALASPRESAARGSQVSFRHPQAYPVSRGVAHRRCRSRLPQPRHSPLRHHAALPAPCRCVGRGGGARADHGERRLDGAQDRYAGTGHVRPSARAVLFQGRSRIDKADITGRAGPRQGLKDR